jgi:hypothetical protein
MRHGISLVSKEDSRMIGWSDSALLRFAIFFKGDPFPRSSPRPGGFPAIKISVGAAHEVRVPSAYFVRGSFHYRK